MAFKEKIHLTILFGVDDSAEDKAKEIASKYGAISIKTKGLKYFDNGGYTVAVIECDSPELIKLHKELEDNIESNFKHKYTPHITIAYLQPDERIEADIPEVKWEINTVEISTTDGKLKKLTTKLNNKQITAALAIPIRESLDYPHSWDLHKKDRKKKDKKEKKKASETKEFDGKKYKKCTGWGLSGSIAAAFDVIIREGDTWVPANRYDELKKAMQDIEKDLKKDFKKGSILDRPREELDPAIWLKPTDKDKLPMLKPNVKIHIVKNFFDYISDFGGYLNPQLWVKNMFYTGSTATYTYHDKSDIDIHIIVDWQDMLKENPGKVRENIETVWEELHDTFWWTLNQKKLPGTKHPLTYFVVRPGNEKSVIEQKEEIYDIGHNVWLIPPPAQPIAVPEEAMAIAVTEAAEIIARIEEYLRDARTNAIDYNMLQLLEQMSPETTPTLLQQLDKKRQQLDNELIKLKNEYALLKQKRQDAFEGGTPVAPSESKNFTMGNIIYKLVERYKLMDILRQIKKITDAKPLKHDQVEKIFEALGLKEEDNNDK